MPKNNFQKNKQSIIKAEDRLPPQNIEAEKSVLGCLMLDKDAVVRITDILKSEDFYRGVHQNIYQVMLDLFEKNEPIDLLSLTERLEKKKKLEEVGGNSYLAELINSVPTAAHIIYYAKLVKNKKILRDLIGASHEINQLSYQEPEDIEGLVDEAEQKIFSISQSSPHQKFVSIKEELKKAMERIDQIHGEGKTRGIPTGFAGLDNYLSGFQKSDMIILAGRPSLGKTSLALDFARHTAIDNKIPVAIFSLEMAKEQLVDRIIASQAGINMWQMRTGTLPEDHFIRINKAMNDLSQAPIFIDDTSSPTVMQIRSTARRIQAEHNLGMIIIDYIQLIQPRSSLDSTVQQFTEISRHIKTLARELELPVVALSQLNRAVEHRSPAIPKLADLRESGGLEQDSDVVLMIYRKDREKANWSHQEEEGNQNEAYKNLKSADIIIAKHRNGPIGKVELCFNEERVCFQTPPAEMYLNQ